MNGPDAAAFRAQMHEHGYVLVRGAVPVSVVSQVAERITAVLARAGLACPAGSRDVQADRALFRQLYSLAEVHRLPHHPQLLALAAALLDVPADSDSILVHPRPALRVVFPHQPEELAATPAHQDLLGMQGAREAYTIWVALAPCPVEAGVLAVAGRSHRGGLRPYLPVPGARVACCDAGDLEGSWVSTDLDAGDAIAFHCLTVHKTLPNRSAGVRLSIDARYQRAADPVCAATIAGMADLAWDDLYAAWGPENDHLRRYWERLPLDVVTLDPSLLAGASPGTPSAHS